MSYWLKSKERELDKKKAALDEGVRQLSRDTNASITEYNHLQDSIERLQATAAKVATAIQAVSDQLAVEEEKLEALARQNTENEKKLPFWKQALGTLSVLTKAIPVYQPALGIIGSGLETLSAIDQNHPLDTVQSLVNVADKLNNDTFDESYKGLQQNIQDLIRPRAG
jgi:hypothetical protein